MSAQSDEYSQIGNPKGILKGIDVLDSRAIDPVEMCLPGRFMNKAALSNFTTNNCPKFMVQRCANKWDTYCDIYIKESLKSIPGDLNDQELFMKQVVDSKFCRMNPDIPDSQNCKVMRELFDPTLINSPIITSDVGSIIYTTGPLGEYKETGGCPHTCDKIDFKTIEDDPLFKLCLSKPEEDPYRSVIDTVCLAAKDKGYVIKTDKLKNICMKRYDSLKQFDNIVKKQEKVLLGSSKESGNKNIAVTIGFAVIAVILAVVIYRRYRAI